MLGITRTSASRHRAPSSRRGNRNTYFSLTRSATLSQPMPSKSARTGRSSGNCAAINCSASAGDNSNSGVHGWGKLWPSIHEELDLPGIDFGIVDDLVFDHE